MHVRSFIRFNPALVALIVVILSIFDLFIPNYAQLSSKTVSESPCFDPTPTPMRPSLDFLLTMARTMSEPFYVPMASEHLYRSFAEYFLGRSPASQEELDEMNLRISGSITHTWISTGFGQRFIQQCIPALDFFKGLCIAGLGSQKTNLTPVRRTMNTVVWSDNKTAVLFSRCVRGTENDWFVLSPFKTLERDVMKEVLKKVIKLGYNASYAARGRYD